MKTRIYRFALTALLLLAVLTAASCAFPGPDPGPAGQPDSAGEETAPEIPTGTPTEASTRPVKPVDGPCEHGVESAEIAWHRDKTCFFTEYTSYRCRECGKMWEITGTEQFEHEYVDGFCVHCGLNEGADTFFEFKCKNLSSGLYIKSVSAEYNDVRETKDTIVLPTVWAYGGEVLRVEGISDAFAYNTNIKTVIIPEGYTYIGTEAFDHAVNLETVVLPSTLTMIGDRAFCNDYKIKSITLPESMTSIGTSAFDNCSGLAEIGLPDGCAAIGDSAFRNCAIASIDLPSSLTRISSYLLNGCANLTSVTIPDGVTYIGEYAFSRTGITNVTIPASVTGLSLRAFGWMPIKELIIPDTVAEVRYELENCPNLEIIRLPDTLTSWGGFRDLPALKSINIPTALTKINESDLTGCPALEEIIISSDHPVWTLQDGMLIRRSDKTVVGILNIEEMIVPDDGSVLAIGSNACRGRTNLKRVVIPGTVKTVGWTAFCDCTGLESVELGVGISELEGYCFSNCSSLTSFAFPDKAAVGPEVLSGCTKLREVSIPLNFMPDKYESLEFLFKSDTALETVRFAGKIAGWEKKDAAYHLTNSMPAGTVIVCTDGNIVKE